MHHGQHHNLIADSAKVPCIGKSLDERTPGLAVNTGICRRRLQDGGNGLIDSLCEETTKAEPSLLVPAPRVEQL